MKIRVAGYQMAVYPKDIPRNAEKICEAIQRAAKEKAEILLTPEYSIVAYPQDADIPALHAALKRVTDCARQHGIGLALGTCFLETDGKRYNEVRFYRPDGTFLGFHSKILRCGTLTPPHLGEMTDYDMRELGVFTWKPDLVIGGLICNDMWGNPNCTPLPDTHLTQRLKELGAHIIFHAVNGARKGNEWSKIAWQFHESNLRMRARASKIWVVTVDNSDPVDMDCSAPSGVITPQGDWACKLPPRGEHMFFHTIDTTADAAKA